MNPLDRIITLYADFETRVQTRISDLFGSECSACSSVCCKPEYCRETLECVFLSRLREVNQPAASYSAESGWLSASGCVLAIGRPPVCYEFLCEGILAAQPTPIHRFVASALSQLISHIGKHAFRDKHIVEISTAGELAHIKRSIFERRLAEAQAAFQVIESFYKNFFLSEKDGAKLTKIVSAPTEVICRDTDYNNAVLA